MTDYVDTHIHLDLLDTPELLVAEARVAGIGGWVVPGVDPGSWSSLMAMAEGMPDVYAAPGIHPQAAAHCTAVHVKELRQLALHPRVIAIGEVGLDRQSEVPWQTQEEVFVKMIRLAREVEKPLLIHARRSSERVLELLHKEGAAAVGGIFHAFSGSPETARRVIASGFALGIGGVLTYQTARRLPEVVRAVPAEALVLETDAPDMTPEPHRGQTNRPDYLPLIADKVAALRGWSREETARITTANACRILGLPCAAFTKGKKHEHP